VINSNGTYRNYFPQGPNSLSVKNLNWVNGKLIVAHGGFSETHSPLYNNDGFSVFEKENWKNFTANNYPALADVRDVVVSHAIPNSDKIYLGSYVNGLLEESNGVFK